MTELAYVSGSNPEFCGFNSHLGDKNCGTDGSCHLDRFLNYPNHNDCFENEKLEFESNKWINHYCVDFLFKNKYYFEVDGEQHFTNESIEHDNEREEFLKEKGFFCIGRCRWKTFKSFNDEEKRNYILELVAKIREL